MGFKSPTPVVGMDAQSSYVPKNDHVGDAVQLGLSLLGDGFFCFRGTKIVDGQPARPIKDLVAEVVPSTGKTVKIRDYVALIDGIIITDKNKEHLNFALSNATSYTVQGSGDIYLLMKPKRAVSPFDGLERPNHDRGDIEESATPAGLNDGKITICKLTGVPASGTITAGMIDMSVKDCLNDLDTVQASVEASQGITLLQLQSYVLSQLVPIVAQLTSNQTTITQIQTDVAALQVLINNALAAFTNDISLIQGQINTINTNFTTLANQVLTLSATVVGISNDLQLAVVNFNTLISGNTTMINNLATEVGVLSGQLASALITLYTPTTGVVDQLADDEARITALEQQVTDLQADLLNVESLGSFAGAVAVADINNPASDYSIDPFGNWQLPLTQALTTLLTDNFGTGSTIDETKWQRDQAFFGAGVFPNRIVGGAAMLEFANPDDGNRHSGFTGIAQVIGDSVMEFDVTVLSGDPFNAFSFRPYAQSLATGYIAPLGGASHAYYTFQPDIAVSKNVAGLPGGLNLRDVNNDLVYFPLLTVGVQYHIKLVFSTVAKSVTLYVNNVLQWTGFDNDLGGVAPLFAHGGNMTFVPTVNRVVAIDNFVATGIGTAFELNGLIQTLALPEFAAAGKAKYDMDAVIPAGTSVQVDISLDGGTNYKTSVLESDTVNINEAPFNGTPTTVMVKLTLVSNDNAVTPKVKSFRLAVSGNLLTSDYVALKEKINDVIARHNAGTLNVAPTIDLL